MTTTVDALRVPLLGLAALRLEPTRDGGAVASWVVGGQRRRVVVQPRPGRLEILAVVGREALAPPRRVLLEAARLRVGSVALIKGKYVLCCAVPPDAHERVRDLAVYLGDEAVRWAAALAPPGARTETVFSHYQL